jgi:y4mF family transcriptional regulator
LETLRERVEQARQVPNVRAEPAPEHMAPSDETVRIEPRGSGGPQLGSAADVGRLVRERRRQAGMSQGELALTAHTGRRFISELEAGKPTVELERVLTILRALEIRLLAEPRSHER